jgi:ribosomal protein S15P/S13E
MTTRPESIAAASILTARAQTGADHFGNKSKDRHPYRALGGAVRSRPLEGLAAFLTRD